MAPASFTGGYEAMLTHAQKKMLIDMAKRAIHAELQGSSLHIPTISDPALMEHRGAFVTLKIHGSLRGCIGTFVAAKPLIEVVADMAVQAAFHDPRFRPLTHDEFHRIHVEISVLSPLREISDIEEIEVGTHGIYLIKGTHHGVLLPQVATEYGWDRHQFLDQTCIKAGLRPGCWKGPDARILIFSAEVFDETSL